MKKRILLTTLIITVIGLLVFSVISTNMTYLSLLENSKQFLASEINVFDAETFSDDAAGAEKMSRMLGGIRVTFMNLDGVVTGDSTGESAAGTPHADREEVRIAMINGVGTSTRRSDTVKENMLYYCRKFDDRLVRLAAPTSSEWDIIVSSLPTIGWFLALDVIFCLIFTFFATAYILKPVEQLALQSGKSRPETKYSELKPLADILDRKNAEIEEQMDVIRREQSRVEAAQASKDEFISNITHEMNTPLTSIKGFAELLESGNLDKQTSERAVHVIKAQADRLTGLIACIINYNELDNDDLPCYDCNVSAIARDVAESLRPDIESRGLSLSLDIDPDLTVPSRNERLTEIFGNLIRNATKYNRENGSVKVTVRAGTECYAEVADTGIGIAAENLDKIFSRFFTVDKSHSGKNGGFGLGLAVVKKLCSKAGWKLTVESTPDVGSVFRIYF